MRTTEEGRPDAVARNRDVSIRGLLYFAFWLAVGLIASGAAMFLLFRALEKKDRAQEGNLSPMVAASLARTPPEPRLEPYPLAPRLKLRAEEEEILTSYGWVDKTRGLVRLPIEQAMELLVQRGLPQAAAPPPPSGAPPERAP